MKEEELREKLAETLLAYDKSRIAPGGDAVDIEVTAVETIMQLIKADREAAVREALEPKRVQCFCKVECGKCGNEILVKKMYLFPNDISTTEIQSHQPTNTKEKE